jgi:hypothetical protein
MVVGGRAVASGTRDAVRDALSRQEALLVCLVAGFENARATHPPASLAGEWHGPGQRAYADSVRGLLRELEVVSDCLGSALTHTRRALDTLGYG